MKKIDGNSKISYLIAFGYGGIGLVISLTEVIYVLQVLNEYNDKKSVFLSCLPSLVMIFIYLFIAFILTLIWFIKRRNLPSKIAMVLMLISIMIILGFILYFII